ncbi:hypothetical protein [Streptacidiphilus jiangxiensis]|uniref:SPFH domain / Band 7 family protein n=1 Tax=Streptacidiphilus jiangxiensis TaxID=235985 RepID=A0A1H7J2L6_STRJI|nr:hypothetical protein [Streptacidiphilus jiangxiensis]SEK68993.1 hypothetical protein SAMN05414137_103126 [Streptacidiphilus jiangxiensis]
MNYPILLEKTLARPESRWPRRTRREDTPALPPGAVFVFRVGGDYREYPRDLVFDPTHPDVLDASSVSLVDTRWRMVTVDRVVPSISEGASFTLRASFRCQVSNAVTVAREGINDVSALLSAYLGQDYKLISIAAAHAMTDVNAVRAEVKARLDASMAVAPPDIDGLSIEFMTIEVLTPHDVGEHERKLMEEARRQELAKRRGTYEAGLVEESAALIGRGSAWTDAQALVHGSLSPAELADRRRQAELDAEVARAQQEALALERAHEMALRRLETETRLVHAVLDQLAASGTYVNYEDVLHQVLGRGGVSAAEEPHELGSGGATPADRNDGRPQQGSRPQDGFINDEEGLYS